jgi:transaldolase / glucose-6-phosphate isomerase
VTIAPDELVRRIWARDASAWTGRDEAAWLGWLDAPARMRQLAPEIERFAEQVADEFGDVVLLGMGGSSLAPEVIRQTFGSAAFHVLDTTHPAAIRALERELDVQRTLFVAASKSGSTTETLSHLAYFWEQVKRPDHFAVITDPGSSLEALAADRKFRAVFHGEPTIGGRYSALSPFGIVPAALMGVDLAQFLDRAEQMREACESTSSPGLALGLELGTKWLEGRDKVAINPNRHGFGLWAEQLLAESTGKDGKGLVPSPGESPSGPDRQEAAVEIGDDYDLGAEFFRWEFATAVAGAIIGINPFDQPNVQEAKDSTKRILESGAEPSVEPEGSLDELLDGAAPPDYVAIQAFIDPAHEGRLDPLIRRVLGTGCVVTVGLGPRFLHSTGQLHKGGPDTIRAIQVVDETGDEIAIPGQPYGFGKLIRAQAAGDFASLQERGRRVVRVRLDDL